MRTRDVEVLAEAYSAIKEASLATGNVPGQTQYNPYTVSPALKAAGQDYVNTMQSVGQGLGQGLKTAGKVLTNPVAASAAFGSWVQTNNMDSVKAAFKQKEGEQTLDKIIQLSGIPNTYDNRKKIHDAVAKVVYSIIDPRIQIDPAIKTPAPLPTMGATPAISTPPTTPSKIAVRPK